MPYSNEKQDYSAAEISAIGGSAGGNPVFDDELWNPEALDNKSFLNGNTGRNVSLANSSQNELLPNHSKDPKECGPPWQWPIHKHSHTAHGVNSNVNLNLGNLYLQRARRRTSWNLLNLSDQEDFQRRENSGEDRLVTNIEYNADQITSPRSTLGLNSRPSKEVSLPPRDTQQGSRHMSGLPTLNTDPIPVGPFIRTLRCGLFGREIIPPQGSGDTPGPLSSDRVKGPQRPLWQSVFGEDTNPSDVLLNDEPKDEQILELLDEILAISGQLSSRTERRPAMLGVQTLPDASSDHDMPDAGNSEVHRGTILPIGREGAAEATNKDEHRCVVCSKVYKNLRALNYHAISHVGHAARVMGPGDSLDNRCPFCPAILSVAGSMKSHIANHYGRVGDLSPEQRALAASLITGKAPLRCGQCPFTTARNASLSNHLLSHEEGRGFCKCKICGVVLTSKYVAKMHQHVHENKESSRPQEKGIGTHVIYDAGNKEEEEDSKGEAAATAPSSTQDDNLDIQENAYPCRICGVSLRTRQYRRAHYDAHRKYELLTPPKRFLKRNWEEFSGVGITDGRGEIGSSSNRQRLEPAVTDGISQSLNEECPAPSAPVESSSGSNHDGDLPPQEGGSTAEPPAEPDVNGIQLRD